MVFSNYLIEIIEDQSIEKNIRNVCELLLQAENDWPKSFETAKDYLDEVQSIIKDDLTKGSIEKKAAKYSPEKNSWKMESLSCLAKIFEYGDQKTLEEIFVDIDKRLTSNQKLKFK